MRIKGTVSGFIWSVPTALWKEKKTIVSAECAVLYWSQAGLMSSCITLPEPKTFLQVELKSLQALAPKVPLKGGLCY